MLVQTQVALEYQLNESGRLVPFPDSSEQARCVVYRYDDGYTHFFRHDLPPEMLHSLENLAPGLAFTQPEAVLSALGAEPGQMVPVYISGVIGSAPDPTKSTDEPGSEPVPRDGCWVIEQDGKAVAWAWSERSNDHCAELAVEVDEGCRRRGYGRQVAAAWAAEVLASGRIPFYSYEQHNQASQALARSLGVQWFADCIAFD
jgi:hypothetical protein